MAEYTDKLFKKGWSKPGSVNLNKYSSYAEGERDKTPQPTVQKPKGSILSDEAWKKLKPDVQQQLVKSQQSVDKSKADVWGGVLPDLGKAAGAVAKWTGESIVNAPKNVTNFAKDEFNATVGNTVNQAKMSRKVSMDPEMAAQLTKANAEQVKKEVKSGTITQKQADVSVKKTDVNLAKTKRQVAQAEKETGAKYDPSSGVLSALNTAGDVAMVGGAIKGGVKLFEKGVAGLADKTAGKTVEELATATMENKGIKPSPLVETPIDHNVVRAKAEEAIGMKLSDKQAASLAENAPKIETAPTAPQVTKTETTNIPFKDMPKGKSSDYYVEARKIDGQGYQAVVHNLKDKSENIVGIFGHKDTALDVANAQVRDNIIKKADPFKNISQLPDSTKPTPIVTKTPELSSTEAKQVLSTESKPIEAPVEEGNKISGNALRIQQKAVEKKLVDKMSDLPTYRSINMKDQAEQAVKLVNEDRQTAIDIIDGKVQPTGTLKAQSVHQALEDTAMREGDGELLNKLAKSHVNTELSESAQKLRIAAERDPQSPVEQIRQLREERLKSAEKRYKTQFGKELNKTKGIIDRATPRATKQTWTQFIQGLEC